MDVEILEPFVHGLYSDLLEEIFNIFLIIDPGGHSYFIIIACHVHVHVTGKSSNVHAYQEFIKISQFPEILESQAVR